MRELLNAEAAVSAFRAEVVKYSFQGKPVDENFKYDEQVQYSFGYGLSYTQFEQYIDSYKVDNINETVEITVGVKNVGEVKGKDVIQIYTHAPYIEGGVEKAYYSLQEFTKTSELFAPSHFL